MKNINIKNKKYKKCKIIHMGAILIALLLILVSISTASDIKIEKKSTSYLLQDGWETQDSGTTQTLRGVSFVDTNVGTTVGNSATILHTNDEGDIWNSQTCGVSVDLYDVSFYDADIGMAVGNEGTIIYSTNGGDNWNTYQTGWMISYYGAHMVTSAVGFAVGENTIFQPMVTWTTDGWQTNNDVVFYLEHQSVSHEGKLRDVYFTDTSTGFAAAEVWNGEGSIVRTTNGGSVWNTIYWASDSFYGIDFPSENVGYAVGNDGIIAKTSDGGDNWELLTSGVSTDLTDVSFPTEDIGTAVGDNGLIIRTEDCGDTWSVQESGTTQSLNAIDFVDSYNGFAVGNQGTILHTTTELEPVPDLDCSGTLSWTGVTPGATVNGTFTVENIGEPLSMLDWEVESYPDWGTWTFTPSSGDDLLPNNPVTVGVTVIAPDEEEETFNGEVVLVNSEDPTDTCVIDVSLATPVNQQVDNHPLLQMILERFPNAFPILRQLLGL